MSVCIIGGGIAGLTAAIEVKRNNKDIPVTVITTRANNTALSGQRYIARPAHKQTFEELSATIENRASIDTHG